MSMIVIEGRLREIENKILNKIVFTYSCITRERMLCDMENRISFVYDGEMRGELIQDRMYRVRLSYFGINNVLLIEKKLSERNSTNYVCLIQS